MAKLSARGRYKLLQWFTEYDKPSEDVLYEKHVFALMSDRRILRKIQTEFTPGPYGEHKCAGTWKQWKRYKPTVDLNAKVVQLREKIEASEHWAEMKI